MKKLGQIVFEYLLVKSADGTLSVEKVKGLEFSDLLRRYATYTILGKCNSKGNLIPSEFILDLANYKLGENIYHYTCNGCPHEKYCHEEREIPDFDSCKCFELAESMLPKGSKQEDIDSLGFLLESQADISLVWFCIQGAEDLKKLLKL